MAFWTGLYADTKEAETSLEDDIASLAFDGFFRGELPNGGTFDQRYYEDGGYRWDIYAPSSSSKGHSHDRLSSRNGYEHLHD